MLDFTISVDGASYDAINDLHCYPKRYSIGEAVPRFEFVDVPYRDGTLDMTESVSGKVKYADRDLSFPMLIVSDTPQNDYHEVARLFHGKRCKITLQGEEYYYEGRVSIGKLETKNYTWQFNLTMDAHPYRMKDYSNVITSLSPANIVNSGISTVPTLFVNDVATVDVIGKNLIPYPYYHDSPHTSSGVTFNSNSDGTVIANGTLGSSNATFIFVYDTLSLEKGTYVLSGCPSGGASNKWCIRVASVGGSPVLATDIGDGATFTLDDDTYVRIYIRIQSGITVSNYVFKPMLRLATDTDATYEPYHHANKTLQAGTYTDADFTLATGKNVVTTTGGATVIMQYTEKKL